MRILSIYLFLFCLNAQAGFVEIGASGSLRESNLDDDNGTETRSITGSISYYFLENSAIELSYTEGFQETQGTANVGGTATAYNQIVNFEMIGLDFILSGGDKNAVLKPYIKAGGAYQLKEIEFKLVGSEKFMDDTDGMFITYGIGFKLRFSKNWSIKVGYDGYTGPVDNDKQQEQTDSTTRAGISFIF